jgi:hypothetical protein
MTSLILAATLMTQPALAAVRGSATASSTLVNQDRKRLEARNAMDGLLKTSWAESKEGQGEGAWLEINLGHVIDVTEISIWPGNLEQGAKSFRENARPRNIKLTLSGARVSPTILEVQLEDRMHRADIPFEGRGRILRIDVVDVYEGFVFPDLHIAEVGINFHSSLDHIMPLVKWLDSDAAGRAHAGHEKAVRDAFSKIQESEFGDDASLVFLMDQAGDGADYVRRKANQYVDAGYLAAAIRPDPDGVEALRKLKDPNAIPALELAHLRLKGDRADEMKEIIEYFYAYQTFIGGGRNNIPNWGTEGWELGAIQSFGEPVAIEVDQFGNLLLADTGNHRIQRFNRDGKSERQWGPEAGITSEWFDEGRTFFVSGAAPGDAAGSFLTPLDVELLPGKENDGFAVLDAKGRVQIFDGEGNGVIGWVVEFQSSVDPEVGGEGYLTWLPKKKILFVVLGRDFVGYTLDGEEVVRTELKDGTPNAMEASPRGNYLMLVYGREVIRYDADGFRFGVIMGEEDLGIGFEDMDLTLDEDGRIWAITDQGWALRFKKPGKLDYKIRFSEIDLVHPRIAVQEEYIYVVDRDRIVRLDVRQARLDEAAAAAEN